MEVWALVSIVGVVILGVLYFQSRTALRDSEKSNKKLANDITGHLNTINEKHEELRILKSDLSYLKSTTEHLKKFETIKDLDLESQRMIKEAEESVKRASIESESIISKANLDAEQITYHAKSSLSGIEAEVNSLKYNYSNAMDVYAKLKKESDVLQDNLDISAYGIYEPHFDFDTSDRFKDEIKNVREKLKGLIKVDKAVDGGEGWTVNGSQSEGKQMVKRNKKVILRAFNGECDSFISNVSWNNIGRMEERTQKSFDAISKMGETTGLAIANNYCDLKLKELRLTHEFRLKRYEEKEEQKAIKEQMREEERARRDYEKAIADAEKEEKLLQKALKEAQKQMQAASAEERAQFEQQLKELEGKLHDAEESNKRALSMAQQTKSGHVYVISNIGSFGENMYKIGMTRRLEPLDRVHELGDASVPFKFDVHAMIYSDNAPALENQLHKLFHEKRVNLVNLRREFFNISLGEIKEEVERAHGEFEFVFDHEAVEYRESLTIRNEFGVGVEEVVGETVGEDAFPVELKI
ncbi:MAG: DUF4041 domain-containing protein [Fibrobacterales bacterium]